MGKIDGMRGILGLLLVSPVVPMYTVPMCTVPRPLRCLPSSATSSPPIVMRFGGGDRSDVQTNQMILRKEQRNALIVAKSLESFSVFALVYGSAYTGASPLPLFHSVGF